ncbi:MAG: hypothetical protein HQM08_18330 [Candidatus Riflebacteria bacterium]|nr:hypothetical protein [Candidatus Riflebacteria bacterium]
MLDLISTEKIYYRIFDLVVESHVEFPGLLKTPCEDADVKINFTSVPDELEGKINWGDNFEASKNQLLIITKRIAKILVSDGEKIEVEPRIGASDEEIRLLLFGWGFGALLHQRNVFPLHAGVISDGSGSVAFSAASGVGKSSLISTFLKKGYLLMDDNLAALGIGSGEPVVYPGSYEIKLNQDMVKFWKDNHFSMKGPVLSKEGKYFVDACNHFQIKPEPLKRIYILKRTDSPALSIKTLNGASLFKTLTENTFCLQFMRGMGKIKEHFESIRTLANSVPVTEVQFSVKKFSPDTLVVALEEDFKK